MSTKVKAKSDFKQVPPGTHPAYCYAVIDIGMQDSHYGVKPQVILSFEFPMETVIVDGEEKPMIMSGFYTASISAKATLRGDLEAWRGRAFTAEELEGFELRAVIGKPCTLSVFHNEDGKARIKGISAAMKGMSLPAMHNKPLWFDLDEHGVGSPQYEQVPDWIKEFIKRRVIEDEATPDPDTPAAHDFDDDIPF